MSIVQYRAPAQPNSQTASAYGNSIWSAGGSNVIAGMAPSAGTLWAIWPIIVPNINTGEAFNGIYFDGGADFTVPPGGVGITRGVNVFGNIFNSAAGFNGQAGNGGAIASLVGTGSGISVHALMTKAGFTSSDIRNGTFYVGISGQSGAQNPPNIGTLRWGALGFTMYTGPDVPNPPIANNSGTLTNPNANTDPGKVPGVEQFASLSFRLDTPTSLTGLNHQWNLLTPGLTFASNGLQQINVGGLVSGQLSNTGVINIAGNVPAGSYPISVTTRSNFTLWANLVVRNPGQMSSMFMEF